MENKSKFETNNKLETSDVEKIQNKVFSELGSDKHVCGIIADLSRGNMSDRDNVVAGDIGNVISKYPDKGSYEQATDNFLARLAEKNTPQKVEEYSYASAKLELAIYDENTSEQKLVSSPNNGLWDYEKGNMPDSIAVEVNELNQAPSNGLWEFEKGSDKAKVLSPSDMPYSMRKKQ